MYQDNFINPIYFGMWVFLTCIWAIQIVDVLFDKPFRIIDIWYLIPIIPLVTSFIYNLYHYVKVRKDLLD